MRLGVNPHLPSSDEYFMYEALRLAHRGLGWTSPNPPVGCVVVKDGEVIGQGWHVQPGGLHAETAALQQCPDAAGATAYVTLEPCSHVGQQPACTAELARAGIRRVVFGCEDADARSAGRATGVLTRIGIEVRVGVLEQECELLLMPYLHAKRYGRPHVHLKLAVSLDAKIALANGDSQWLSGPESLGLAHYLRQQYDAVLIGRGTVVADNPRLTVRREVLENYMDASGFRLRDPVRLVVDPQLKLLDQLGKLRLANPGTQRSNLPHLVIVTSREVRPEERNLVEQLKIQAQFLHVTCEPRLDLQQVFAQLWQLGITSVLVEGGARLAAEVLRQSAADQLTLVYTPVLLGSDGLGFSPDLGLESLITAPSLDLTYSMLLGRDTVVSSSISH